jgi:pimeloyl-ACP methyl ester carboxylesterase
MHRILKGSRLEILEDAGHVPNYERADEFNKLAKDFF